jgi:hypothetical protein
MLVDVESVVRNVLKTAADYRFHRHHRIQAKNSLRSIEGNLGRTNPTDIKLADAYARDVLGDAHYAPWLHVYTALAGTFKEGWIPDNYYGSVVVPRIKGGYGKISHLKSLANIIFNNDAFPDLAYFVNGLFFASDQAPIPQRDVKDILFGRTDRVVFKLDRSFQGTGIFFFDKSTFDIDTIKSLGNGVLQKYIVQHELFDAFATRSVATLRVTSIVDDDGHVGVRACFLRLGTGDDTHIQPTSEICVPVNLSTGELSRTGYTPDWLGIEEHPDTKIKFCGMRIPMFSECLSTVLDLHRKIPFARCVGWDLTIDNEDRVRLMEWNGEHNDIKFSEATQGPCFADLGWERLPRRQFAG